MTYRIAFTGNILPDFDRIDVQTQTKVLLKLSNDEVLKFFAKNKVILKKNISLENATALQQRLQSIGLEICIESEESIMAPAPSHETPPLHYQGETNEQAAEAKPKRKHYQEHADHDNRFHDIEYTSLKSARFTLFLAGRLERFAFSNQIAVILLSLVLPIVITLAFKTVNVSDITGFKNSMVLNQIISIYCIAALMYYARMVVLRLHDCNLPGYFGLLYLALPIPYIGKPIAILATLFLCIYPGQNQANAYGKTPETPKPIGAIAIAIFTAIILISPISWNQSI